MSKMTVRLRNLIKNRSIRNNNMKMTYLEDYKEWTVKSLKKTSKTSGSLFIKKTLISSKNIFRQKKTLSYTRADVKLLKRGWSRHGTSSPRNTWTNVSILNYLQRKSSKKTIDNRILNTSKACVTKNLNKKNKIEKFDRPKNRLEKII